MHITNEYAKFMHHKYSVSMIKYPTCNENHIYCKSYSFMEWKYPLTTFYANSGYLNFSLTIHVFHKQMSNSLFFITPKLNLFFFFHFQLAQFVPLKDF